MEATSRLRLPPDAILVPVAGDRILTRPGRRSPARRLTGADAGLLEEFRSPSTVAEAILRYSRSLHLDPETVLEEAYPLLADLFAVGLLVEEGDEERSARLPSLDPGETFAGLEILDSLRVEEDVETYQVRSGVLKVGPVRREAAILRHLAGRSAPRLLRTGRWRGRSYLLLEWCRGIRIDRVDRAEADRRRVEEAFAEIHSLGVIHGDVRPENILVDEDGKVTLVGFGRASRSRRTAEERRAVKELLDGLGKARIPSPTRIPERPKEDAILPGSINMGIAGVALGLYQMARAREDAGLLAEADSWIRREAREPERAGAVSPFLSDSAVPAVEALIAQALGDEPRSKLALERFAAAARRPSDLLDLFLGRTGLLLACALLHLRDPGEDIAAPLWRELDAMPPIGCRTPRPNLGIAHGWAGYLYATLLFHQTTGYPLPPRLTERLGELADEAISRGRGLLWRWEVSIQQPGSMPSTPGWCNGSAGFVFLWMTAYRTLGDPAYLDLARGAAWNAWEGELPGENGSLCCGLAGRAYALLHLFRHGEGTVWLERARELARRAVEALPRSTGHPLSLYRGELGVAVLHADLERPGSAAMPFFEVNGSCSGSP